MGCRRSISKNVGGTSQEDVGFVTQTSEVRRGAEVSGY